MTSQADRIAHAKWKREYYLPKLDDIDAKIMLVNEQLAGLAKQTKELVDVRAGHERDRAALLRDMKRDTI